MPEPLETDIYEIYGVAAAMVDAQERQHYIEQQCGHDPELRDRLCAMLAVQQEADLLFEGADERQTVHDDGDTAKLTPLGRVGRFRLEKLVGRGGMGNVFLAFDEQLERPVALKFPRLDTLGNSQLLENFLREARLAAQLKHVGLVEIYEVGVWGQACFIASQWCDGGDLARWLEEHPGPCDPQWSVQLLRDISRAVAYCHGRNVVHLDIKPGNIMLASEENHTATDTPVRLRPMLTDFGVARVIEEGLAKTHTSMLLGTPLYMAPEQAQCRREAIGPASDVFALGVILYELLYGRRPFDGESAIEVIDQIRSHETISLPASTAVRRDLQTICQRCLEPEPTARYSSADALADDLDRFLRGEPIQARPVSWLSRHMRWFERPERVTQAGLVSLVIQTLIVANMVVGLLMMAAGVDIGIDGNLSEIALNFLQLGAPVHGPSLLFAWFAFRRHHWAVLLGTLTSLITAYLMGSVLFSGTSPLAFYNGHRMALFLMHMIWLSVIMVQLAAYVMALPAALKGLRRN